MTVLVSVLTVIVGLLTVLVAGLLRSHAAILRRLHELDAGLEHDHGPGDGLPRDPRPRWDGDPRSAPAHRRRAAEDLSGTDLRGASRVIRLTEVDRATVVAFLSSGCSGCGPFWEAFREQPSVPGDSRLVIVAKDPDNESLAALTDLAPNGIPVLLSSDAWDAFNVPGSPYFVLVDGASGTVRGEGTAADWPAVQRLLAQASGDVTLLGGHGAPAKYRADALREQDTDAALLTAGIVPGDDSLYGRADGTRAPADTTLPGTPDDRPHA